MARVAVVVEILPEDQDVDLGELIRRIRIGLPEGFELKDHEVAPMAFGLSVIRAVFTIPEEEGVTERLERYLAGIEGVQEVNVLKATRL